MRLHRFFARNFSSTPENVGTSDITKIAEGSTVTYAHDTHQWQRVFRYGQGDRVILFDGSGNDYVCEIQQYQDEITVLRIVEIRENNIKPARQVILAAALVKRDSFEWIAEKATELGVTEIIPLISERSEKKNMNTDRLEKIIIEATEQSGRGNVPILHPVTDMSDIMKNISNIAGIIVFDPSGRKFVEKDFCEKKLTVFVGPEGGWSPEELTTFEKANVPVLSFGPQILRAETAVIAALSRVVF